MPSGGTIDAFLKPFEVLPFHHEAADEYARFRFELQRVGRPIGERDLLIASIAVARGLVVVTHNVSEFGRLAGLIVEDWSYRGGRHPGDDELAITAAGRRATMEKR